MLRKRKNRREEIVEATVRLVARHGVNGASIRQIAAEAGVSEGALYRHFASKEDLCQQAYVQIVADMAGEKERILQSGKPVAEKLRDWVRVSYEYFDRYPAAFTYVVLTDHDFPDDITRRQGRMLTEMLAGAIDDGQVPAMEPVVAMSHFSGLMLNIPRLINEGTLPAPAVAYTDTTSAAACAVFGLGAPGDSS